MNLDKQSIAAIVAGVLALVLWYTFGPDMTPEPPPEPAARKVAAANQKVPAKAAVEQKVSTPAKTVAAKAMPAVALTAEDSTYFIQPVNGTLEKIVLPESFLKKDRKSAIEITNDFPEQAEVAAEYGAFGLRTDRGAVATVKIDQSRKIDDSTYLLARTMRDASGGEFTLINTYKALPGYRLEVKSQIVNNSKKALYIPALTISAGDLQQWQKLSGDAKSPSQELHTVEYCTLTGKVKNENANADNDDWAELTGKPVRWFGCTNRFFAQLMKVSDPVKLYADRVENPSGSKEFTVSTGATLESFQLAPGAVKEFKADYYLGPKQPSQLRAFDPDASEVMPLGWFPIDFLAYIMLAILNWLHSFVGSFGWSIILLTLLIRTIFFPVTMKANASMREMQQLSPKLKEIREKYKNEPMVAQTKMSELYREHKVNPMSGCLPMIIQIPVFIALYYALGGAAELRHQSFWWINDLSQPDTVAHIFNIAINPLILVWTVLMLVQQKLTPTAMDPMQAKMMLAMPVVMLFFLYSLPAALTLYWSVSQIFSIAQMLYQNKVKKREDAIRQAKQNQEKSQDKPKIVRS